jgi:peptide/nickel transport system substrate-binding protein
MLRSPAVGVWRTLAIAASAAILLAACSNAATSAGQNKGGVVTFAESPGSTPNYIYPMASSSFFTFANIGEFTPNLYLPLYWFGNKGKPGVNEALSVAEPPVFSHGNTEVTVTLKHWVWSNGQPITARDVIFWMNLLSAVTDPQAPAIGSNSAPGPGWGGDVPGGFPENVVSYSASGTYSVVFHLNAAYNPTWYFDNELSQIYTMPQASWDKLSAAGPVGDYDTSAAAREVAPSSLGLPANSYIPVNPGTASGGALGVAQFLNLQSEDLSTYATNPLWKVVDGPFKLSEFTTGGFAKLVPNRRYSGPVRPTISAFEELPFTSDSAEFDAVKSGSLTIGYVPSQDLGQTASLSHQGYSVNPWYVFGFTYIPYNFTNPTAGPIFKQLYFRQAVQSLVNQPEYIKEFEHGVGTISNGPVPSYPKNNAYESTLEVRGQVYPYDPQKAVSLLRANGWTVVPGGASYCSKPGTSAGQCGAGIAADQKLTFTMLYASGATDLANEMETLQSTLQAKAGIDLTLSTSTTVLSTVYNSCTPSTPCSGWQLADWGTGASWVYLPDYLPTGGEIFSTGASANPGYYSSSTNNANIAATHTAATGADEISSLRTYENYLARQLPGIWMPNIPYQETVYKSTLKGLVPQGIYTEIYPQQYSF